MLLTVWMKKCINGHWYEQIFSYEVFRKTQILSLDKGPNS